MTVTTPTKSGYYWASWEGSPVRTIVHYEQSSGKVRAIGTAEVYAVEDLHRWVEIPVEKSKLPI